MSCEKYRINENNNYDKKRQTYLNQLINIFKENNDDTEKIYDFPKYSPNNSIKQFLIRYELIKLIKDIPGDIIECGVCGGRGLFSLLQSHLILEPNFFYRKIIGFDTFSGFSKLNDLDNKHVNKIGDFKFENIEELLNLGKIHTEFQYEDLNKISLVKGNAEETIPEYINKNKHILISLLYLDFDLYEPTKIALKYFLPRMCKGSIIVFDEINFEKFPGETIALLETLNINNYEIKNLLNSNVNYIKLT
jgi:hypothetical protein